MLGKVEPFFGKSFSWNPARMLHEVRAVPRLVVVGPKCAQLASLKAHVLRGHRRPDLVQVRTCESVADTLVQTILAATRTVPSALADSRFRLPDYGSIQILDGGGAFR